MGVGSRLADKKRGGVFLMDEYYWNLIMDIADREKVNLPREDKYSAGAIGFMYAINEYE